MDILMEQVIDAWVNDDANNFCLCPSASRVVPAFVRHRCQLKFGSKNNNFGMRNFGYQMGNPISSLLEELAVSLFE